MLTGTPRLLALSVLLIGGCASDSEGTESGVLASTGSNGASTSTPAPTSPAASPSTTAPTPAPSTSATQTVPVAPASGKQYAPLKGSAKDVTRATQAEADATFRVICDCWGGGNPGPCKFALFGWDRMQLSECYYTAFDNTPTALETVEGCIVDRLKAHQAKYRGMNDCTKVTYGIVQEQVPRDFRACALAEPTLKRKLNICDGTPPSQ